MSTSVLRSSASVGDDLHLSKSLRMAIDAIVNSLKNTLGRRNTKPEKILVLGLLPPDINHEQLDLGLDYFHTQVSNLFNEKVTITGEFVNGTNWLKQRTEKERPEITKSRINLGLIIPFQMSDFQLGHDPRVIKHPDLVKYFDNHPHGTHNN